MTAIAEAIMIEVAALSDPGRRRADNQDNMMVADLGVAAIAESARPDAFERSIKLRHHGCIMLVADGMGGAAGGAIASRMAVQSIEATMRGLGPNPAAVTYAMRLKAAVENAGADIYAAALQDMQYFGMGTTATLAGVLNDVVYIAQVGDSRAYLVRNGEAVQVTRDQSVVQEMIDAGAMTEAEAETSVHSNKILQALGATPAVQAVVTGNQLRAGDVMLLCSDGLTRVVRRDEIADLATRADRMTTLCANLVNLANERGGPDNVTVVAARFTGGSLLDPTPADIIARTNFTSAEDGITVTQPRIVPTAID